MPRPTTSSDSSVTAATCSVSPIWHRSRRSRQARAPPASATALLGTMKMLVPLAGLIDADAEISRLEKRLARTQSDRTKLVDKLANAGFVSRAPAELVEEERGRLAELERACSQLEVQLERLRALAAAPATGE
jgi:valyl-tRNA synthetase